MDGTGKQVNGRSVVDEFLIPRITTPPEKSIFQGLPQDIHNEKVTSIKSNNNNNKPISTNAIIGDGFLESYPEINLGNKNKEMLTSCSSIDNDTIYLVVSGKSFCISKYALMSFPNTKLGKLAKRHHNHQGRIEYVFDRNSKIVEAVLDFYRTGELHLPRNLCSLSIRRELRYWDISDDLISECCYGRYKDALKEMSIVDELDKVNLITPHPLPGSYKEMVWNIMERPGSSHLSWIWLGIYMMFILLSVLLVCISTMRRFRVVRDIDEPDSDDSSVFVNLINTKLSTLLTVFDVLGLIFFTIEPGVRLWACPSRGTHLQEFLNLLDFLLAMDHWICVCLESSDHLMNQHRTTRIAVTVFRSVLSLRVLRIFHLTRKNVKTKVLLLTFRASLTDILLLLLGLSMGVITFATLVYYAEMIYDSGSFQNIPEAVWWAIITMTTVGYGDYFPTTFPGYVIGVACALCGLLLLSMPIAVTAANFNTYFSGLVAKEQRHRRKIALKTSRVELFKKEETDSSDDSSFSEELTMSSNCSDESKDDVFWFGNSVDYKWQYQSDGALHVRGVAPQTKSASPASFYQTTSENSLCPPTTLSRTFISSPVQHNNVRRLKPNNPQLKSNYLAKAPSTSLIINAETNKVMRNYNSINGDRSSSKKYKTFDSVVQRTQERLDSVDKIRRRRKKYRARRRTRGSSMDLGVNKSNNFTCQ